MDMINVETQKNAADKEQLTVERHLAQGAQLVRGTQKSPACTPSTRTAFQHTDLVDGQTATVMLSGVSESSNRRGSVTPRMEKLRNSHSDTPLRLNNQRPFYSSAGQSCSLAPKNFCVAQFVLRQVNGRCWQMVAGTDFLLPFLLSN